MAYRTLSSFTGVQRSGWDEFLKETKPPPLSSAHDLYNWVLQALIEAHLTKSNPKRYAFLHNVLCRMIVSQDEMVENRGEDNCIPTYDKEDAEDVAIVEGALIIHQCEDQPLSVCPKPVGVYKAAFKAIHSMVNEAGMKKETCMFHQRSGDYCTGIWSAAGIFDIYDGVNREFKQSFKVTDMMGALRDVFLMTSPRDYIVDRSRCEFENFQVLSTDLFPRRLPKAVLKDAV